MGLDSHSALLMVRPIHLGLRNSCPSRLMAAPVCLTVAAWLPYPPRAKAWFFYQPGWTTCRHSSSVQCYSAWRTWMDVFRTWSSRIPEVIRMIGLVFFLSPSSHNWLSCFRTWQWWGCTFFYRNPTNSVIGRNAGVHIDFLVCRLVEGVISWVDWNVEKLPVLIQLSIKGFDLIT